MPDNNSVRDIGCTEAVSVEVNRIYDCCSDKDCLSDLRVFFTDMDQVLIDRAVSVRAKKAHVIATYIDVEPLPFNRGYFSCDLTFFFEVEFEVFSSLNQPCELVSGVCVFRKRVILFGSEGNVRIFSSEMRLDSCASRPNLGEPSRNLPRCSVQIAEPVILSSCVTDPCDRRRCKCDCDCGCNSIPGSIAEYFGGAFVDPNDSKAVYVTLGIFSIIQLTRTVQLVVPAFDFCMPSKECGTPGIDDPCDLFDKMCFPVNDFFPPQMPESGGCGCG